ncbi:uncharacterized protein BXZ73DRAFT_82009 [Epithele typhae]|uniref:uncharacterized protein n=1 Tax=Epithele typhae TaxID=378194 RepID=UPI002008B07F|nr:uncharacterized protein BXZ73DRAFT_82009 [Epithele typhae]KAH9913073.1 hypothetical protein BXZ73DRAFT_82009 [Epithele typhae]
MSGDQTSYDPELITLISYEYIITLDAELDLFWRQRITGASAIFLINRYWVLIYNLTLLQDYRPFSQSSCAVWVNGTRVVEILSYVPWASFSALRAFALSGRSWLVGGVVLLLSMAPVGVNFVDFRYSTVTIDPIWGCGQDVAESYSLSTALTAISRSSLILSDLIVIVVTWMATYKATKIARAAGQNLRYSFSVLLLRDGSVAASLLVPKVESVLTCSQILTSSTDDISSIILLVEPYTLTDATRDAPRMNAVLVGRFLLNLQDTNFRISQAGMTSLPTRDGPLRADQDRINTVVFFKERVLGSLADSIGDDSTAIEDGSNEYELSPELEYRGVTRNDVRATGHGPCSTEGERGM